MSAITQVDIATPEGVLSLSNRPDMIGWIYLADNCYGLGGNTGAHWEGQPSKDELQLIFEIMREHKRYREAAELLGSVWFGLFPVPVVNTATAQD